MITRLLLVRHGLTDWNVARRWQGHTDIPLNEEGRAQAAAVAARLDSWSVDAIVSSDLRRCQETARVIAECHNLTPHLRAVWRERHVGDFAGLSNADIEQQYAGLWRKTPKGMFDPPHGEPFTAVQARAQRAYAETVAEFRGQTVIVVSHGGLFHILIAQLIGIESGQYGRFSLGGNTGLSILDVNEQGPTLTRLNDTSHLER